ncbi:MAG: methylated-DNA--[protein]-cysteine S-methyltransferase [Muribaculaceae bacterium]|nr:methylated-DNA--[protein]-cysteine S-methyltransferase [Muribaculaceae bacterium]
MKNKIFVTDYHSPCGNLCLGSYGNSLCLCDWSAERDRETIVKRLIRMLDAEIIEGKTPVTIAAVNQLDEYFAGKRLNFDIPLIVCGTEFQCRVWDELQRLNYGQRITYRELAERIGNKKASRAVAGACNANALSIFIPCHRIVGSSGSMTGYAGGLLAKSYLLELEKSFKS